jgi:hypothetical protein
MKHTHYLLALALALLTASSCSDGLQLGPDAVDGRWVAVDEMPGMSLHLILIVQNGSISGSGSWTGEAILGGDVTATGQSAGRDVVLDLTFEHLDNGVPTGTPFTEHFAGAFTSANDIEGTTTENGVPGTLHLQRLTGP